MSKEGRLQKVPKPKELKREWFLVDAQDKVLGRLSSVASKILQGKHRPYYTPHWDMGDHLVIINAAKVRLTGRKEEDKIYYRHSGYPGGLKQETAASLRQRRPQELIRRAVRGMLPKNRLARRMIKKLHVYPGSEHPHQAQKPKKLELSCV